MQRQRGELVPIGEVVADLGGPVKECRAWGVASRIAITGPSRSETALPIGTNSGHEPQWC